MERECDSCGVLYDAKRPNSKYHSNTCRQRGNRAPKPRTARPAPTAVVPAKPPTSPGLTAAVARELTDAGRLDTVFGQAALVLAGRLESPMETGASIASMTKQLRETMADALKGAESAADSLDELRSRRDAKRNVG